MSCKWNIIRSRSARALRGFTLTELLVAIALLVVLMLAVSTIFRTTAQTVSTGIATTELTRRLASAQVGLRTDIVGAGVTDVRNGAMLPVNAPAGFPPFLLVNSIRQYGYRDRQHWIAEGSVDPLVTPPPVDAAHAFRQDCLGFFTTGNRRRQTGGRTTGMVETQTPQTSPLAYVWYGHLWQPRNGDPLNDVNPFSPWYRDGNPAGGQVTYPGLGNPLTNPNNYFASQWTLGRVALLMFTPADITNPNNGVLSESMIQAMPADYRYVSYYGRNPVTSGASPVFLSPLSYVNDGVRNANPVAGAAGYAAGEVWRSRYDAIGTYAGFSWDNYAGLFYTRRDPGAVDWTDPAGQRFTAFQHLWYRFRGIPNPDIYAGTSAAQFADLMSMNVPAFIPNCMQFRVEFAGDYITQDALGRVPSAMPYTGAFGTPDYAAPNVDGVIDYNVDPVTGARSIRWYGLPENPGMLIPDPTQLVNPGDAGLTIPVAPVYYSRGNGPGQANHQIMPFEEACPNHPISNNANKHDVANQYLCSWSPREMHAPGEAAAVPAPTAQLAPQLIRITIQLVDAEGRLEEGMTQQFIFPVRFQ